MSDRLTAAFDVVGIVTMLGLIPAVVWVGKRIARANRADTEAATRRAVRDEVGPVATDVRDLRDRMTRVEGQYSNNGGSTLRDRVDTAVRASGEIKASFDAFTGRFEDHLADARDDRDRLARLERAFFQRGG